MTIMPCNGMLGRNSAIAFRNFVDYWLEHMIILMWYLANFDTSYIIVRNDENFKKNKFSKSKMLVRKAESLLNIIFLRH